MTPSEAPYYIKGNNDSNEASAQISHLVRSGADARRLLVPIRDLADLIGQEPLALGIESILKAWDDPSFASRAPRARKLLDQLDTAFTSGDHGIDLLQLGEIRVPLNALVEAITRREKQLRLA